MKTSDATFTGDAWEITLSPHRVHTGADATKLVLAGADVVMMTSALLEHGPDHMATVLADLRSWFDERSYDSVQQARGSLSQEPSPDPDAFERANYMKTLRSYSAGFGVAETH